MVELTLYTPEMPWEPVSFFPGNAEVKILRTEAEGGARTLLVRLPAGGEISPHSHLGVVQHYVLEGEYETKGEMFGIGTYRLLPKHANVGTISTEQGAVILMIYDPVTG
jgi:ChrR Cupin-like domain